MDFGPRKHLKGRCGQQLKLGRADAVEGVEMLDVRFGKEKVGAGDGPVVDADAVPAVEEVGGGEAAGEEPGGGERCGDVGADGALWWVWVVGR